MKYSNSKIEDITLDKCNIIRNLDGTNVSRRIILSLPGIMNLHGIKDKINNYQVGHQQFNNKFGKLYVACDFCVRYHPRESKLYDFRNGFEFRSLYGWGDFRGRDFMISRLTTILESDDAQSIISKIGQHNNLRPFLDSFFNWLNESIRVYGEKFFELKN